MAPQSTKATKQGMDALRPDATTGSADAAVCGSGFGGDGVSCRVIDVNTGAAANLQTGIGRFSAQRSAHKLAVSHDVPRCTTETNGVEPAMIPGDTASAAAPI